MSNSGVGASPACFHFVMIKPTHYDDDGYPIQWFRSAIPSNTQIIRMIAQEGGRALIGLVGVQSNHFPRAIDLARPFLAAKLPVCIGAAIGATACRSRTRCCFTPSIGAAAR